MQESKGPSLSEWDMKYTLPESLQDLLSTYENQISLTSYKEDPSSPLKPKADIIEDEEDLLASTSEDQAALDQIQKLREAVDFQEKVKLALDGVLKNAKDYEDNIKQIDDIKTSVIEKISKFYNESSKLLDQQKMYVDTGVHVQTILRYFLDFEKLTKDVDNLSGNKKNIHIYEQNIQRFLSEIMEAIEFFQSKPNYIYSAEYQQKYDALKNSLLSLIKNTFVKIFTGEYNEVSQKLDKFPFANLEIASANENLINVTSNTELFKILYPDFSGKFSDAGVNLPENTHISKTMRDLLTYMRSLGVFDYDCQQMLDDVFSSYYCLNRKMIQKKVLEQVFTQIQKIPQKTVQRLVGITITYVLMVSYFELMYYTAYFNNTSMLVENSYIKEVIDEIMTNYFDFLFGFIQMENNIQNIFEAIDSLNYFIDPICLEQKPTAEVVEGEGFPVASVNFRNSDLEREQNIIKTIKANLEKGKNFEDLILIQKRIKDKDTSNFQNFSVIYVDFCLKIKAEMNKKLIDMTKYYLEKNLSNFNVAQYWKEFNQKFNQSTEEFKKNDVYKSPYFRVDMKFEIFPLIKRSVELLFNLKNRIDSRSYQDIVNQMIISAVNYTYLASEQFVEKTDSYLFLLKNFIYLNEKLEEFQIRFKLDDDKDYSVEGSGLLDRLWVNLPYFGGKKTSKKMTEFGADLKMPPNKHLEIISELFSDDIEFIISIRLNEYLERYQKLTNLLQDQPEVAASPELSPTQEKKESEPTNPDETHKEALKKKVSSDWDSAQKDLDSTLSKDMVKKCYFMFTQNMEDILQDIAQKMSNYLDHVGYSLVLGLVRGIISELMQKLSDFERIVASHYKDEYDEFNFVDIREYKIKLLNYFGIKKDEEQEAKDDGGYQDI